MSPKSAVHRPDVDETAEPHEPADDAAPRRRWVVPAVLVLITALLVALGVVLLVRADQRRGQASANSAVVDNVATTEVIGQVSTALNRILSYDYASPAATQQAADAVLTGDAATQYTTLFTALQAKAPGQKLTLRASVVTAGVSSLVGTTAQLLVFVDQSSTQAGATTAKTYAAQIQITAVRTGDVWKISELVPL